MARLGQFRRDTLANWKATNPILADGEFGLVASDSTNPHKYTYWICGDGISTFSQLPMSDMASGVGITGITSELGEDGSLAMSQKEVTNIYRKFLSDKSFSGLVNIDENYLFNLSEGQVNGEYKKDINFDTAWIQIFDSSKITITGAIITRVLFFKDINIIFENLISTTTSITNVNIPEETKLCLLTLRKSDNPNGYNDIRIIQDGAGVNKKELNEFDTNLNNLILNDKYSFLLDRSFSNSPNIDKGYFFNITNEVNRYEKSDVLSSAWIQIFNNSKYLEISGAIHVRTLFFSSFNFDSYIGNNVTTKSLIPTNAKMALITLRDSDNPDGYLNLKVKQLGSGASKFELEEVLKKLLPDSSFSNIPNIHYNHLYNIPTEGDSSYIENDNFDTAWIRIFESEGTISATGATILSYRYFTNLIPTVESYIPGNSINIPSNAKLCLLTMRKSDNPDGYLNLKVKQLGSGVIRKEIPKFINKIIGKNLINSDDLLYGVTYSSSTGLIESEYGILSNKIRLRPGIYTLQGLRPYRSVQTSARILCYNDKDEMVRADLITLDADTGIGYYNLKVGGTINNSYISYWRLVLQFSQDVLFDVNKAQFEFNNQATSFEKCKTKPFLNPNYLYTPRTCFMTGASSSMPGNGYFENACERLGFKAINRAISGDSVMMHATMAWRGTLYTQEELENIDIFVTSHIHNYNVNYEGKEFKKVESFYGFYTISGVFNANSLYILDKYFISPNDINLLVSTIAGDSTTPYVLFFNKDNEFLGYDIVLDGQSGPISIIDREIVIPENTDYILIKRLASFEQTKLRGKTTILCNTVEEYELKGYDENNNLLTVPLDKENPNHRIVPYGGGGAPGPATPNALYDERYSAGYDYLLKKYAKDCYDLRLNPNSKWYGTKSGKPCIIVCTTQWHDGYVRFNESVKKMAKKHGAIVADIANNIGFSYLQTNPNDENSIRWSALHCNNADFSSGNDTEDIYIDGVLYSNMGWHPTRDFDCYIQQKRGNILAETLKLASYNLSMYDL